MRLSRYFLPILRETPKEAEIVSHRLMLRAGMIRQEAAGIYSWLPLGLRVLKKIEQIVREEQNRAGAIELLMPTIQSAELWRESGRYDDYGKEMLRINDRHERDMLFGPTNEEMITEIFRAYVRSYKDLPQNLYHIQWKFRDEVRPRFGVMRVARIPDEGRLFLRPRSKAPSTSYNRMFVAYLRTFARMGLKAIPMAADTGRSAAISATNSSSWPRPARAKSSATATISAARCRPETIEFDDAATLAAIVERWTSNYAATDEMHEPRPLRGAAGRGAGSRRAASRSANFLLRHEIFRSRWAPGDRARRQGSPGPYGLLRHRPVAPRRGDHRGEP